MGSIDSLVKHTFSNQDEVYVVSDFDKKYYLKIADNLEDEYNNTRWLKSYINIPEIVGYEKNEGRDSLLLSEVDGKSSEEKGFIGHYYGYMGKYFQPFDNRHSLDSIKKTSNKVTKIGEKVKNVSFSHRKYTQYSKLKNYVIYCDPPYQKQSHYYTETGEHVEPFDHDKFWDWCRKMAKNNIVLISEYKAPRDFDMIWSTKSRTTGKSMIDKLYYI